MCNIPAYHNPGPVKVCLGLGANRGNPVENIFAAFDRISGSVLSGARLSGLYITEPQDVIEQPEFINAACCGRFDGSPMDLLKKIGSVEKVLGRNRGIEQRRGPRNIDIDILSFGGYIVNEGSEENGEGNWLIVPHERLRERRFALVPLLELEPSLVDPLSGKPFRSFLDNLEDQSVIPF